MILNDSKPNSKVLNDDGLHHRFLESMVSVGCYWMKTRSLPMGLSGAKPKLASPKTWAAYNKLNGIYGVWMGMVISQYFTWDSMD